MATRISSYFNSVTCSRRQTMCKAMMDRISAKRNGREKVQEKSTARASQYQQRMQRGDRFYKCYRLLIPYPRMPCSAVERCSVLQYYCCSSRHAEVTVSGHSILFACLIIFVKYPVQALRHVIRFGRAAIVPFKIFT